MTTRESKRIWRHRQAAIESHMRSLQKSSERASPDSGILQRILNNYHREWVRYNQLIHANDRFKLRA
jgi:hypothetical protein